MSAGSAAGMKSLAKVWNLFFNFQTLKSMGICEKLWTIKKKVWNFCLFPEKNFEAQKYACPSNAGLIESSLSDVPSFHVCSYSSYKLRRASPELLARRFKKILKYRPRSQWCHGGRTPFRPFMDQTLWKFMCIGREGLRIFAV